MPEVVGGGDAEESRGGVDAEEELQLPPLVTTSDNDGANDEKREIGSEAVWSLSTAKPGNGVEQIREFLCLTTPPNPTTNPVHERVIFDASPN
jgi:hypothetical protein